MKKLILFFLLLSCNCIKLSIVGKTSNRLEQAIIEENINLIKEYLEQDDILELIKVENNLLHKAGKVGNEEIIKLLLFKDINIDFKNKNGNTALMLASGLGVKG